MTTSGSIARARSIALVAAGIVLHAMAVGCAESAEKPDAVATQLPNIVLERFSLVETKEGRKLWHLNAVTAQVFDALITVDTVDVRFYNEAQEEYAHLFGKSGALNTRTNNILVKHNVRLLTSDSATLFTDSIFWLNDSGHILSDAPVRIVKQDSTVIEGRGLKTKPDLKRIEIIGDIRGASPIQMPSIK